MIYSIIPVKPLARAKQRLESMLTASERQALVAAMLDDVLATLRAAPVIDRIGVISRDPTVLALAAGRGAEPLHDEADDLNGALAQAARHAVASGATAMLVLPADVPLVTPAEIAALVAALNGHPGAVLAPARDGGTNALLASPPDVLPFQFGPGSLARHLAAAQARQVMARVVYLPGLELDIDRPADVLALAAAPGERGAQRLARAGAGPGAERSGAVG
jgi:2-phospho-L-lactate guanylyltransferase